MNRTIEITVAPTGEIQIDAIGFKSADCEAATRFLEVALGPIGTKTHKPEYHQRQVNHRQQKAGT